MNAILKSISKLLTNIFTVLFVILFMGLFDSCYAHIDPVAANSSSAILAVLGEYLYALFALVLFVVLWILRPAGITLVGLGVLGLFDYVEMVVNPILLICIGFMMFLTSFAPIKQYEPMVVISKHFKMPTKECSRKKDTGLSNYFIQLLVGVITLLIEYTLFVQ